MPEQEGSAHAPEPPESAHAPEPLEETQTEDHEDEQPVVAPGMTWCILRTATNMEPRVAKALTNRDDLAGVGRVLVPTLAERQVRAGVARVVEKKLYPGYVFAELELADGQVTDEVWYAVKSITGALGFLGERRPTPVSEAEAAAILEAAAQKEKRVQGPDFQPGDLVEVSAGSFAGHTGVVERIDERKAMATVDIVIFGRSTPVDIECWQLEKQL